MRRCVEQLRLDSASAKEIAFRLGFSSPASFHRAFPPPGWAAPSGSIGARGTRRPTHSECSPTAGEKARGRERSSSFRAGHGACRAPGAGEIARCQTHATGGRAEGREPARHHLAAVSSTRRCKLTSGERRSSAPASDRSAHQSCGAVDARAGCRVRDPGGVARPGGDHVARSRGDARSRRRAAPVVRDRWRGVREVLVQVGDLVAPGQPIARLDSTSLSATLQQAEADLETQRSRAQRERRDARHSYDRQTELPLGNARPSRKTESRAKRRR